MTTRVLLYLRLLVLSSAISTDAEYTNITGKETSPLNEKEDFNLPIEDRTVTNGEVRVRDNKGTTGFLVVIIDNLFFSDSLILLK